MTSKLSVNMAYFCTNFVIIMQLSYVRQVGAFLYICLNSSKEVAKEVLRMHSFTKSSQNPPWKIFLRSFENVAPGFQDNYGS